MFKKTSILLLLILFPFFTAWETSLNRGIPDVSNLPEAVLWSDSVYKTMTLREKIGQLFVVAIDAKDTDGNRTNIQKFVDEYKVGGLLFSKGDAVSQLKLTNLAQSKSRIPLLITLDGEWGLAMRLSDAPRFPMNMTIGAANNDSLTYAYGREIGRECRRMGIHVNFAPDIDVNSNPDNPVIGRRSLGDSPKVVARLGIMYAKGISDEGIIPVAKHFPGHGDVTTDSHKALPINNKSLSKLEKEELMPFREYINAGMKGIMTGHLLIPALDDKTGLPASLSPIIVDSLLRKKMHFNKLVFTDALEMKGAASEGQALKAIVAGNDILLKPENVAEQINEIESAINEGTLPEVKLRNAVERILRYKYSIRNANKREIEIENITKDINSPIAGELIYSLYANAITVLKNEKSIIPFHRLNKRCFTVKCFGSKENSPFSERIKTYTGIDTSLPEKEEIMIIGIYSDLDKYVTQVKEVCNGKKYILVFFTSPYTLKKYSNIIHGANAVVVAYEDEITAQECAAEILFGGLGAKGIIPVNISPLYKRGRGIKTEPTRLGYSPAEYVDMDIDALKAIDAIVMEGLEKNAYPGCQVLVARRGKIVYNKSFGNLDGDKNHPVNVENIYDLASVTKCAATMPAIMNIYSKGELNPNLPLAHYIQGLQDSNLADITVEQALYHESGLPSGLRLPYILIDSTSYKAPLFSQRMHKNYRIKIGDNTYANNKAVLRNDLLSHVHDSIFSLKISDGLYAKPVIKDTLFAEILKIAPSNDKKYRYSDINFILLQHVVEELEGVSIDKLTDSIFYAPLGMAHTGYMPLSRFRKEVIAPTEEDNFLRKQILQGYTHDETACFMGGVSGNAGLFSTASDLAKLLQMYLNGGLYGGERFMTEESIALFTENKSPNSRRAMGFDKPDMANQGNSPTAPETPESAYGHTGYTGTAFWVDPENELIYIFLSNRVYPHRWNTKLLDLNIRPRIQSAIYKAIKTAPARRSISESL
ncbi:MAG: glycoside hydrolase family 3 N-terminal domain-containing protein [Bacteroidales bacterium]